MTLGSALRLGRGQVAALVGSGGKTTLMTLLAEELRLRGWKVLLTTTTKIYYPYEAPPGAVVISGELDHALEACRAAAGVHNPVFLGAEAVANPGGRGKLGGVDPGWPIRFVGPGAFDAAVVEADGSAGKPIKGHAYYEPVVPALCSAVVAVAGLQGLGSPLMPEYVHRPEIVASVTGLAPGEPVTPKAVARLLVELLPRLREAAPQARVAAFLNGTDVPGAMEASRAILPSLLCGGYDVVLAGRRVEGKVKVSVLGERAT